MFKRSFSLFVILFLMICLPLSVVAEGYYVHDDTNLVSNIATSQLKTIRDVVPTVSSHLASHSRSSHSINIGGVLLTSVLIGAIVAVVALLIMRAGMNTKRKQHGAVEYMKQGSYRLKLHRDMFLYSHVSKTPRQNNSSSSSTNRSTGR